MIEYLKLENVADERGEEPAKVARTLLRIGCDLYLHFGPSRKSRSGVSFYPEHPTVQMEHNIGPGDHPLTKDSQEVFIKRLDGVIISISHDVMTYFESNATEGHLTKESFRHAIKRLRENPPK